jgi:hypothetical protein
MNANLRQGVTPGHRDRVLRALGVTPWVRRGKPELQEVVAEPDQLTPSTPGTGCVVVLPEGCSTRELDLLGRALNAGGSVLARSARVTVNAGQLAAGVPSAQAYLVFGEAQAHALGRSLPAAVMHQAVIVLADEPALVLSSAGAKRRLWSALRSLRRALAAAGG